MKQIILIFFLLSSFNALADSSFSIKTEHFALPDGWSLGEVAAISEDVYGNTYVFNRGHHPLLKFDQSGKFIAEIGKGQFSKPHGMRIDRHGNIWTTDIETHLVLRFSSKGQVTMVLGMRNKASSGWFDRDYNLVLFDSPQDVAFDQLNNIYVVDKGNSRVVKLNSDGLLVKTWGTRGKDNGEFNFAHSIVIDKDNRVFVADRENKRIQIFDLEGNYLNQWNNVGYPYVLTLSGNTLWMTDARSEQIKQFTLDGKLLASFQGQSGRNAEQFGFVHGIHITKQGTIKATQILNWNVLTLTPQD